jgi:tripartite-type tricarboxylate transporter receptor subunit TctC
VTHPPQVRKTRPGRRLLLAGVAFAALCGAVASVQAQDYPNKPIRLVVPYPPGGATDVIGRVMAQKLSTALGQQVIVDNRGGAAGSIGATAVARAPADGYTLLMGAMTSHSINAALFAQTVPFDLEKGFSHVAIVGTVPLIFVVNPSVKANTLSELIALAKANPGTLTFASSGNGSPQHLAGEMFQRMAGVQMLHIPYKGSGPAMTDLIGGQVLTMIETAPAAQPHIKAGKLRALAVASSQPVPTMPDIPTTSQAGLKGFEVSSMFGIAAPAGTPAPIIAKLNAAIKSFMSLPDVKEGLLSQGAIATYTTPDEAAQAIHAEIAKWTKVIKDANIKPD